MSTKHSLPSCLPAGAPPIGRSLRLLLLCSLVLLGAPKTTLAQPAVPSDGGGGGGYTVSVNPLVAVVIVAIVVAFFFLAFFAVFFRRCTDRNPPDAPALASNAAGTGRRSARRRGLDPAVLETFPMIPYAEAKGLQLGKGDLDCAVCLSEFKDDDMLRMLPKCCHVFHPGCIDTWLASHVTCPVCRANLDEPSDLDPDSAAEAETLDSGAGWPAPPPVTADQPVIASGGSDRSPEAVEIGERKGRSGGYGRSHSVGYAEGATGKVDRFRLRLPEHLRREIVATGRLRRGEAAGAVTPGWERLRRAASVGNETVASRRGSSGRSGRWATILRSFSWRRRGEGEATAEPSSRRSHTPGVEEKETAPWV